MQGGTRMQGRNERKELVLASLTAAMVSMAAALTGQDCFYPPEACGGQEPFIRGDLNADGRVSISDQVFLRGLLFEGSLRLYCFDAADIIDDDFPDTCDLVALTSLNGVYPGGTPGYLFDWSQTIAPPFPD